MHDPKKQTVIVSSTGQGKFQQNIQAGNHRLIGDEPVDAGGDDTGPTPYDYLMIALGTCKAMTLQMYAERRNMPLEGVEVRLTHTKMNARDCSECETTSGKLDKFECDVTLKGDRLTDEQRERLMEIADKCPVHKMLKSEIKIQTNFKHKFVYGCARPLLHG